MRANLVVIVSTHILGFLILANRCAAIPLYSVLVAGVSLLQRIKRYRKLFFFKKSYLLC